MNSLSHAEKERALECFLQLNVGRRIGQEEQWVADRFDFGSVEAMYIELRRCGFPEWAVHKEGQLSEDSNLARQRDPQHLAAEADELPSATNADASFRTTVRTLEYYLEHVSDLKETRRGKLFIGEGPSGETYREARGGQWHPHPYLVALIGAYVLEHCVYTSERYGDWGSILRLLNELHPRPSEANSKQLANLLYGRLRLKNGKLVPEGDGFLNRARQIAALVRGAHEVPSGIKNPAVKQLDQVWAWHTEGLVKQGLSRKEILEKEREEFELWKREARRSVLAELESEKQTLDDNEFTQLSRNAHEYLQQLVETTFDEEEFNRIWSLYKDQI
jgi:hypothetical protein